MEQQERVRITLETTVPVSPELAWEYWTEPRHITQWNQASEDWHTPRAENDLRVGGAFTSRMESKDGKFGFDFGGDGDRMDQRPNHDDEPLERSLPPTRRAAPERDGASSQLEPERRLGRRDLQRPGPVVDHQLEHARSWTGCRIQHQAPPLEFEGKRGAGIPSPD